MSFVHIIVIDNILNMSFVHIIIIDNVLNQSIHPILMQRIFFVAGSVLQSGRHWRSLYGEQSGHKIFFCIIYY